MLCKGAMQSIGNAACNLARSLLGASSNIERRVGRALYVVLVRRMVVVCNILIK
jgi:hypothetical protein